MKKLFLLDAYALIYRAYYGFIRNPRINSKGLNTSAIYGFVNVLEEILREEKPTHIAVGFDLSAPTFRHTIYPEYKAQREETPEDIKKSVPIIKEIIRAYNIPIIEKEGFEADDVIGAMAKLAEKADFDTFMMTPDKDYAQLVSDKIFMYKPRRSGKDVEILDKKAVCEKYSIKDPLQVIDILAMMGDASDNIPGAVGIGEKTAIKLISKYETVEGIYEHINELKGKQKENLINFKEQSKMSKILVTISIDMELGILPDELIIKGANKESLIKLFTELEFNYFLNKLNGLTNSSPIKISNEKQVSSKKKAVDTAQTSMFDSLFPAEEVATEIKTELNTINNVKHNYILSDNADKRKELISLLSNEKEFCFDTETTGLEIHSSDIVGMSFSWKNNEAYYVPVPKDITEKTKVISEFKEVFQNTEISKIGQNIKFDILMLKNYGIEVYGKLFDTMIAHYLIQPETRHNLNALSATYLKYKPIEIEELIGKKGKRQKNMQDIELEKMLDYAAEDADLTFQLKNILATELDKNNLTVLFTDIEMPLVPVLADMEYTGVNLDIEALKIFSGDLKSQIIAIEDNIHTLSGEEFNIASPKQLGDVLFDKMKIVSDPKKTKTGSYATGEEILAKLKDKHEIIPKILEYRGLKKLLSTYVDALPKLINKNTGRLHTSFNQALVSTGRLSSSNPNLQNIPIRDANGKEVRKAFIPTDNEHVFLSADYSQVELRIMAHLSKDEAMIEAFNNNEDIHTATAAKIYKLPLTEVTKEMRSNAKSANFGIIYGISAFGLAQNIGISRKEAKELISGYFNTYPLVNKYMQDSILKARDNGYVITIKGRKRQLADINSRNGIVRSVAERNAINAPIQGSAADIVKIAMINIYAKMKENNLQSKMIIQVHDELNFDVPKSEIDQMKSIIKYEMENAIKLTVPLLVDMGEGVNWLEAH